MSNKKSLWSIMFFAILVLTFMFSISLSYQGKEVFAETEEEQEHISFEITVDGESSKVINVPYQDNEGLLAIKYTVTENTGVDALQLQLSYDAEAFTLDHVTTKDDTALGAATKNGANIVFDNVNTANDNAVYTATGDALIVAYFSVNANAIKAKSYSFGIANVNDGKDFSNAWRIVKDSENASTHTPVEIRFTSPTVYIRGTFEFTLTGGQKVYDKVAALDSAITVNTECTNVPELTKVWFTKQANSEYYTKLDSNPVNVGTYYVVIEFAATNYYDAYCGYTLVSTGNYTLDSTTGHVATYQITARPISVTINNQTSVYGEAIVSPLTFQITNGSVCEGDILNIAISTTATSSSNVGNYPITGTYDNTNYNVTFTNGTYTITKKAITITALNQEAKYTGSEPAVDQTKYSAYLTNDVETLVEVSGVVITKAAGVNPGTYTLTPYLNNGNYNITYVNGTFTITLSDLTQQQVDALVAAYAKFYAVDNGGSTELTITNQTGSYGKTYDAKAAYIGVLVTTENNNKLAQVVQYKVNNGSYTEITANALNNFAAYAETNAGTYVVKVTFKPGYGYAFATGVDAEYEITLTINRAPLTITASSDVQYKEAEVITVDNGEGWVNSENYATYNTSAEALKAYVTSTYENTMIAGTPYTLSWGDSKTDLEAILTNYVLTLAVEENLTVAKKIVNAATYDFEGYTGVYDGASHNLTVKNADTLITSQFASKGTVKDVADSGTYTATITLKDTANYTFAGGTNTGWTVDGGSATKTATVSITKAPLTIGVAYTKATATFTINGFVAEETEADLTNLAYLADNSASNIEGNVYTISAYVENAITVSATSDNGNYTISNATLKNIRKVEYMAGSYDKTVSGMEPTLPATECLFDGFTATEPAAVALNHYTFERFATSSDNTAAFDFTQAITGNKVVYAIWTLNNKYTITYKYMVEKAHSTLTDYKEAKFFDDVEINYNDELETLDSKDWFKVQEWYLDEELTTKFEDGTKLTEDITLYGNYKFNIGLGDVNASSEVDANDITLYRQWIVGGYEMTVVESGKEWATVNSNNYNKENTYFLKRVADSNAQTSESLELGDNHLDIRDVSTIRMALVGGYGFSIMLGKYVDGEELIVVRSISINNVSDLLIVARSGAEAKLSADIEEVNFSGSLTECEKDVLIDLNGKTLTLKSLSIALKAGNTGKIQIKNGTIRVADGQGVSLLAPNGSVILDNVTLYDEDGQFTLQAASQSLHLLNTVKFLQKGTNSDEEAAQVKVEKDTHVVVEETATVTVEKLVVTNNFKPTTDEQYDIAIENKSSATPTITVEGNTKDYISTLAELLAAAENGGDYKLVSDLRYSGQLSFSKDATLNLNGHKLESVNNVAVSVINGASLTIYGNGTITAQEAALMAFDGSKLTVENGTFNAKDNFVVGTNGSAGQGGNTITINGGTFNGKIQSNNYIACGVYAANNDTITINAGTFNIENGLGVLVRAGHVTVDAGVEFNFTTTENGLTSGYVGDSSKKVPTGKEVVVDYISEYPGKNIDVTYFGQVYAMVGNIDQLLGAAELDNSYTVLLNDITTNDEKPIRFISVNATLDLNGHNITSTNDVALRAIDANLTITGNGTITAQEAALMAFDGATLTVENGTFNSLDNFVVGTNGTEGRGGNTITINGGTFYGNIQSAGYVACGIYVANNDTVVVNGGTFNITNGVGILARSGNTTVAENVVFNVTGNGTLGKVGDSKVTVPAGQALVADYAANYPGGTPTLTNNTNYGVYALVDDEASLNAANQFASTIVLAANITLEKQFNVTRTLTLDLNGHNISNTADLWNESIGSWSLISVQAGKLTINGNGNIIGKVNDCYAADVRDNGELVVNGGTFGGNISAIYVHDGTLTVNGGYFYIQQLNGGNNPYAFVLNCLDANYNTGAAQITVNGGQFENFNPKSCLAEGANTNFSGESTVTSEEVNNKTIYTVQKSN